MTVPYIREHLEAGMIASSGIGALLVIGFMKGLVSTYYDLYRLSLLAFIAVAAANRAGDGATTSSPNLPGGLRSARGIIFVTCPVCVAP